MTESLSSNQLSGAAIDTLLCLFLHGPTWDGDVPSKLGRDELVRLGLASRRDGYQWLTDKGVHIGMERGYIERKEKRDRKVRKLMALPEAQQVRTVVIEHARPAVEPSAGVKCTHCNGNGYNEPIYDEQDGWTDETPCETCDGSGRITTVEQYLKTLPANWHEDSSLETWFPITAEELKRLKDARATVPPPAVDVAPIAKLTVRDGLVQRAGLYAPGLPDGDHDVFPVPLSPKGELRPHVLAEPPKVIRTTDATLNAGLDQLRAIANGQVLKISPLQARLILDYVSHAEPSDTDHCHADPIHCTPECRLKTCDHAWDFNYVPPQCAFGCGATFEG